MKVLVLGAGFGGLELTTRLSDELGDAVEVVLVDKAEGFIFGFSKLDVMFGRTVPDAVLHPYRDLVKPGVRFVQATIESIDPEARRVETDAGAFEADVMVVALGADLDPSATPGLVEGGHEFYTVPGAFALRDVLDRLRRRSRDGRRHVHAVQVPTGPERDRPAAARLPDRAGPSRPVRDLPGDAAPQAHPAVAGRFGRRPRRVRRAGDRVVPRVARPLARPGAQRGPARRRPRAGLRPLPRGARPRGPRGRRGVGHVRRRLDPRRPVHAADRRSTGSTPSAT